VAATPTLGLAWGTLSPTDIAPEATATPINFELGEIAKMEKVPFGIFSIETLISDGFY